MSVRERAMCVYEPEKPSPRVPVGAPISYRTVQVQGEKKSPSPIQKTRAAKIDIAKSQSPLDH